VDRLGDLHGQLARRHEHERAGVRPVAATKPLECGQRERCGLARAGRRLGEDVAPLEQRRDRLALDRRRLLVAEARERRAQGVVQPEARESVGERRRRRGHDRLHRRIVGRHAETCTARLRAAYDLVKP
jgi:hypothetical protein